MKNKYSRYGNFKSGFTLVELSIVLVIIGLLIGGILVGQSLIDNARLKRLLSDLNQYDIATTQFNERFRQIPGDSDLMNSPGNNDGFIEDHSNANTTNYFTNEIPNFWYHLSISNMLQKEFSNSVTSGVEVGTHVPEIEWANDNTGIVVGHTGNATNPWRTKHFMYLLSGLPSTQTRIQGGPCDSDPTCDYGFEVDEAYSIDLKLDDGVSNSGDIQSCGYKGHNCSLQTSCSNQTTGEYLLSNSGDNCSIIIKALFTTGGQD